MPRTWVRKTDRGVDASLLKRAAEKVRKGKSVRAVAKSHGICHVTLNRYWQKYKELKEQGSRDLPRVGYYSPHQGAGGDFVTVYKPGSRYILWANST